jgi:hypothetical protein
VDLITAATLSPTFNFISSALRLVIMLSMMFFADADDHVSHHAAKLNFNHFAFQSISSGECHAANNTPHPP